jgi:hypothetical protein
VGLLTCRSSTCHSVVHDFFLCLLRSVIAFVGFRQLARRHIYERNLLPERVPKFVQHASSAESLRLPTMQSLPLVFPLSDISDISSVPRKTLQLRVHAFGSAMSDTRGAERGPSMPALAATETVLKHCFKLVPIIPIKTTHFLGWLCAVRYWARDSCWAALLP